MNDLPNVQGLADLKRAFDGIVADSRKRVLRKMASAGGRYMRDQVRAATPVGKAPTRKEGKTVQPGALKRGAFYFFARRDSSANQAVFRVTYRRKTAFYAPWVEYGHRIVARFKGKYTDYPVRGKGRLTGLSQRRRASTGRVPPHPWFEAAVRSAAARTIDVQVEAGELEVRKIVNERT